MGLTPVKQTLENSGVGKWNPLPLDFLLERYTLKNVRFQVLLAIWMLGIILSIASVYLLSPEKALMGGTAEISLYSFFLMYPPLLLGTVLLFWLGFEWGFIPVFLSAFLMAYTSSMSLQWALLFGVAFILGLAILALCYYSMPFDPRLNTLKAFAFYTTVAFVAALASSLGSFVWSLYHNLSPAQTLTIWKGWWTGNFLQLIFLVAPLLYLLTPSIERVKTRYFEIPKPNVTMQWIYSAIFSVVMVLTLFIVGAHILASVGIEQQLSQLPQNVVSQIMKVLGSYRIVTWISIGLVVACGFAGIYLVGTWNKMLMEKVEDKADQLLKNEVILKKAVAERDELLKKINIRVKDNFSIVLALLELELKTGESKSDEEIIKDSHARLRSLALVYETMQQTDAVDDLNMKQFCIKLSNRISRSYRKLGRTIDVLIEADDVELNINRGVPFAMILNELLVNAYVHGFNGRESGTIFVEIRQDDHFIHLTVRDNGIGLPSDYDPIKVQSLGMKLILTLTRQLQGDFSVESTEKASFKLKVPREGFQPSEHTSAAS